jgi:hypothetical protein
VPKSIEYAPWKIDKRRKFGRIPETRSAGGRVVMKVDAQRTREKDEKCGGPPRDTRK